MDKDTDTTVAFQDTKAAVQFATYRTLVSLVKCFDGQVVTVELRNESVVTGKIINSDHNMNIEMEEALFYDPLGNRHSFHNFFLQARNIRYIHIPRDVDPETMIRSYWGRSERKPFKKGPRTFKKSRAEKYQKSILEDLNKAGTSSQDQ